MQTIKKKQKNVGPKKGKVKIRKVLGQHK